MIPDNENSYTLRFKLSSSYSTSYFEPFFNYVAMYDSRKKIYERFKKSMKKALKSDAIPLFLGLTAIDGILIVFTLYGL